MIREEILHKMYRNYFVIFTIILLGTAILNPEHQFSLREILLCALFALLGDLPSLVYCSKHKLTIQQMKQRKIIHFLLLEAVILFFGNVMGQVHGFLQNLLFAVEILGIFVLVGVISQRMDQKTADEINEGLVEFKKRQHNNQEN